MPPEPGALTAIHRWVELCRADAHPARVARLPSGWVVMGERQIFAGYCLVLPDPVVAHLNVLEELERAQFLADMARVGDAVLAATGAVRINYALFGNAEPALHAHVFPRRADEAPGIRAAQPWALDWQAAPPFSPDLHAELQGGVAR